MNKKIVLGSLCLLIVDIVTKMLIDYNFSLMSRKDIIPNFFAITKVYNYGASWNILTGHVIILIAISILILFLLYLYHKKFLLNIRNIIAFSLLFGGILGNLLDRILYGYVIDFLDFNIFGYDYPVFNLADTFIVVGIILLIIAIYKKEDEYVSYSRR